MEVAAQARAGWRQVVCGLRYNQSDKAQVKPSMSNTTIQNQYYYQTRGWALECKTHASLQLLYRLQYILTLTLTITRNL